MANFDFSWLAYEKQLNKYMRQKLGQGILFVQFSYWLYRTLMLLTPIGIIATIYVAYHGAPLIKNDWVIFALLTIVIFISGLVARNYCLAEICPEFRDRKYNVLYFINKKIIYTYEKNIGDKNTVYTYWVSLDNINKINYNPKTKLITIYGNINKKINGHRKNVAQECSEFSFLDTYNAPVFKTILKYSNHDTEVVQNKRHII